jgi:hypothetical protein
MCGPDRLVTETSRHLYLPGPTRFDITKTSFVAKIKELLRTFSHVESDHDQNSSCGCGLFAACRALASCGP